MKFLTVCVCLLSAILQSGCSLKSSQMDFLLNKNKNSSTALGAYSWVLEINSENGVFKEMLYSVQSSKGLFFSNNNDVFVRFDGLITRDVLTNNSSFPDYKIIDNLESREIYKNKILQGKLSCGPWLKLTSGKLWIFHQVCEGTVTFSAKIFVSPDNKILKIEKKIGDQCIQLYRSELEL